MNGKAGKGGKERTRKMRDTMGAVDVPTDARYGPQTQRAKKNFNVSGRTLPWAFVRAQLLVKKASAMANGGMGRLSEEQVRAIVSAADTLLQEEDMEDFPVDVYQAGAGTSQNMNVNEVIAHVAFSSEGVELHPNDHVNLGQSTNDTMPTAMNVSTLMMAENHLIPALEELADAFGRKADEFKDIEKAGRTHLRDAVPMTLGDEFSGYQETIRRSTEVLKRSASGLLKINLGGNAVGNAFNNPLGYREKVVEELSRLTDLELKPAPDPFEATQNYAGVLDFSSSLSNTAMGLSKIARDLILLSSGPRTGFAEVNTPPLQPGSSIMPGKVNPVMCEMMLMVCCQVQGNHEALSAGYRESVLELNVTMPMAAYNVLDSVNILANGCRSWGKRSVEKMTADAKRCRDYSRFTMGKATALAPVFGYDQSAKLEKMALDEGVPLPVVLKREKGMSDEDIISLLGEME